MGDAVAQARVMARRTDDGGSAATRDGEDDDAGAPANECMPNLVSKVGNALGS